MLISIEKVGNKKSDYIRIEFKDEKEYNYFYDFVNNIDIDSCTIDPYSDEVVARVQLNIELSGR